MLGMGFFLRPVLQVFEDSQNKEAGLKRKGEQGSGGELKDPGAMIKSLRHRGGNGVQVPLASCSKT